MKRDPSFTGKRSAHLSRKRSPLPHIDPFSAAYAWATAKLRVMVMDAWAEDLEVEASTG